MPFACTIGMAAALLQGARATAQFAANARIKRLAIRLAESGAG